MHDAAKREVLAERRIGEKPPHLFDSPGHNLKTTRVESTVTLRRQDDDRALTLLRQQLDQLLSGSAAIGENQPGALWRRLPLGRAHAAAIQRLGLEPTDAWFTMYGNQPQIVAGVMVTDKKSLEGVLQSDEWTGLTDQLMNFVTEFNYKIVPARKGFQM